MCLPFLYLLFVALIRLVSMIEHLPSHTLCAVSGLLPCIVTQQESALVGKKPDWAHTPKTRQSSPALV